MTDPTTAYYQRQPAEVSDVSELIAVAIVLQQTLVEVMQEIRAARRALEELAAKQA